MIQPTYPYYLGNRPQAPNRDLEVVDKYTGEIATRVALADESAIDAAIGLAERAARPMRELAAHARRAVLDHCLQRCKERAEELAHALCVEAGKPIRDSRGEVARLVDTFAIAAEESVRIQGELMPLDRTPRGAGYLGIWKRVPVGPCSFISPFNFPLNLVAHKIAPALAVGCPFVLKPASATPIGALILGEILAETELPAGAFSILPCRREGAARFSEDERFKLLSFTGSAEVGWELKRRAGKKKVVLELGGNAAVIVERDADLADAVARIVYGAFYQSGQSCVSVQRVYAHEAIYADFAQRLVEATRALKAGDPKREETFIGPLITLADAERLEDWIASAKRRGARVLCGGGRSGAVLEATLLENVPDDEPLCTQEAFGPIAVLAPFSDFDAALDRVNASAFGLQAGVFTRDLHKAMRAWDRLEVGAVLIGEVPSWRSDAMPYGGVKDSGFGREGVRFAMEEMTEIRLMVVRTPPGLVKDGVRDQGSRASALDRFHEPRPSPRLMRALGWLNDRFVLPRLARVREIRLPPEDASRLRAAMQQPFVLCPNHPEFFTDWMLDKWLTSRFAPRAACWADPQVVNGMGRAMRRLWLANGLVAAVRGAEVERALEYSARCLAEGRGALVHPEGEVNWDNEALGTLRAGAVRIAASGAARAVRPALIVTLAWFIRFREDATPGLQRELDYVESRLRVRAPRLAGPAQRLALLYATLLEREAELFGIELGPREDGFARRFERGLLEALRKLADAWPQYRPAALPDEPEAVARAWRSAARKVEDPAPGFAAPIRVLDKMLRLVPAGVGEPTVTQEQVSERVKRLRLDWLRGTLRDGVTRFVPRAAARRDVFVRVGEPLSVGPDVVHEHALARMRERMHAALARAREDGLERLGPPVVYANPFLS